LTIVEKRDKIKSRWDRKSRYSCSNAPHACSPYRVSRCNDTSSTLSPATAPPIGRYSASYWLLTGYKPHHLYHHYLNLIITSYLINYLTSCHFYSNSWNLPSHTYLQLPYYCRGLSWSVFN